jgi:hypothetical protein
MSGEEGEEYRFVSFETTRAQDITKPTDAELKMRPDQGVEFPYRSPVEQVRRSAEDEQGDADKLQAAREVDADHVKHAQEEQATRTWR